MLEYKESLPASFARDLAAFANSAGGKILLGVRDDGTVAGVRDTNELRARIQDLARNCDPPVKVLVEPVGKVLAVTVRESEGKPVQCSEGFFWRQGASTQKLSRDEIRDFFRSEGVIRFDLSICPKFRYPQDFDREKYNAWLRLSGITGRPRTIEFIEKAGTGIKRIRDEARAQGCPEPRFEETGFFTATFFPNPEVRSQAGTMPGPSTGEVTGEVAGEVIRLLTAMKDEMSRGEMQEALHLRHEDHFREAYLVPALKAGLIEMTIPDKPRSSKQRYRTTAAGLEVLGRQKRSAASKGKSRSSR